MIAVMKTGRVAIITRGRYAGKKVRHKFPESRKERIRSTDMESDATATRWRAIALGSRGYAQDTTNEMPSTDKKRENAMGKEHG